ncbi:hypothetical protein BKA93DRAFT_724920 [Sparassis latifolia]
MPGTNTAASIPTVALIGTCDTKLDELVYVHDRIIQEYGVQVKLLDVGRIPASHPSIAISQPEIFASSGLPPPADLMSLPRGELISTLIRHTIPVVASLYQTHAIHAAMALGGSGGSSLAAEVMRGALPLGFPKLLVSTMAGGDVRAYVGESDLVMMHSVVDIAGLNDVLCPILDNAAGAIAGMARAQHSRQLSGSLHAGLSSASPGTKRIAITMFGVTTPAVTHARAILSNYPCTTYVFHATGAGGRALEQLAASNFFAGILDLTTTELADALLGGVLSAGEKRLTAAAKARIPQIVSVGALDMANFGPRDTVPERYSERRLFEHNPSMTLLRTNAQECAILGGQIAERLKDADPKRTEIWVPRAGVSSLSVRGAPFDDQEADEALFKGLRDGLKGAALKVVEDERDINDEGFVEAIVARLVQLMGMEPLQKNEITETTDGTTNGDTVK